MTVDNGQRATERQFEPNEVAAGKVGLAIAGLIALVVVSAAMVAGLLWILPQQKPHPPATDLQARVEIPPPPRLQIAPAQERQTEQAQNKALLEAYGWSDRAAGLAHIPIERAMQILANHGWPDAAETEAGK